MRPAGPGGKRGSLPFGDLEGLGGDGEIKARLHEMADEHLERFLVFVLKLCPGGGANNIRHPHLVNVPGEVVLVIPAADPHPRWGRDLQGGRFGARRTVEDAVDVEERFPFGVRVDDMHPLRWGEPRLPGDVGAGEVTLHPGVGRAAEVHDHLPLRRLVAPAEDPAIGDLRAEPGLRGVIGRSRREGSDRVAAKHPRAAGEMPGRADDALRGACAGVTRFERSGRILDWLVHVEDGNVAIGCIEDGGAVGARRRCGIPPMKRESLAGLAADLRDAHPDDGPERGLVPGLDLVGEHLSRLGSEPEIFSVRLRRGEIEKLAVEPDDDGHVMEDRVGRQVGPLGARQEPEVAGVLPVAQWPTDGSVDRLVGRSGKAIEKRHCRQQQRDDPSDPTVHEQTSE